MNLEDFQGFLAVIAEATKEKGHGFIDVHPDYEQFLPPNIGVIWSNREVVNRETIRFQWVKL